MSLYDDMILAESGLVQYVACSDTAGTQATDSKNAYHGTYTGTFTLNQTSVLPAFSGDPSVYLNSGYIARSYLAALALNDVWTYEFWLKRTTIGTQQSIFGPGVANDVYLYIDTTNVLVMRKDSVANVVVTTAAYTDTTNPYHIVFVKDGATTRKIYVNGQDQAVTDSGNQTFVSAGSGDQHLMALGAAGGGPVPTYGYVAKIARYNVALTSTQVSAHYDAGINGIAVPTVNIYPDADTTTTGWTTTPLWSKIDEISADGTVITATAS
jgi:hypothetical protein